MLRIILSLYLAVYAQVFLHEISHALVACAGDIEIKRICMGYSKSAIAVGRVSVSLIPAGGYVEVSESDLRDKSDFLRFSFMNPERQ